MIKKVIILFPILENEFDIKKRYFEDIERRDYSVEIWALDAICYKGKLIGKRVESNYWNIKYIETKKEFKRILHENREAYFMDYLGDMNKYSVTWIRCMMTKERCRFYFISTSPIPSVSNIGLNSQILADNNQVRISNIVLILNKIKRLGVLGWIKNIWEERILKSIAMIQVKKFQPDIIFLGTQKCMGVVPDVYAKAPIVYTHSHDYEKFKFHTEIMPDEIEACKDCIVFIDEAMTHHPYFRLIGQVVFKTQEDVEKYYVDTCHFFDVIECEYQRPVVIAANPRSQYKGDEFGGRKIIKDQTMNLISVASIVLTYFSTAMSYVALFQKTFIFIDNYNLREVEREFKDAYVSYFDSKYLYVDWVDDLNIKDYENNDKDKMKKYVNDYVKKIQSEDRSFWNIVFDAIEDNKH